MRRHKFHRTGKLRPNVRHDFAAFDVNLLGAPMLLRIEYYDGLALAAAVDSQLAAVVISQRDRTIAGDDDFLTALERVINFRGFRVTILLDSYAVATDRGYFGDDRGMRPKAQDCCDAADNE